MKKQDMAKKMKGDLLREKHAKMANELNARNKANPKKYKQYLEDAHSAAANGHYHYDEN